MAPIDTDTALQPWSAVADRATWSSILLGNRDLEKLDRAPPNGSGDFSPFDAAELLMTPGSR